MGWGAAAAAAAAAAAQCVLGGQACHFANLGAVVVPFNEAGSLARTVLGRPTALLDPELAVYDTAASRARPKVPIVVLLGHYDHGKASYLPARLPCVSLPASACSSGCGALKCLTS